MSATIAEQMTRVKVLCTLCRRVHKVGVNRAIATEFGIATGGYLEVSGCVVCGGFSALNPEKTTLRRLPVQPVESVKGAERSGAHAGVQIEQASHAPPALSVLRGGK